jgi:hypothetical protein
MKRSRGLLLWAIMMFAACGGRLDTDELCTPPDPDLGTCAPVDGHVECPLADGTKWRQLRSGVWLHLRIEPVRVLCDIAPDGRIIARSP